MTASEQDIKGVLARTVDPYSNRPYGEQIKDIAIDAAGRVALTFAPGYPIGRSRTSMIGPLAAALQALGVHDPDVRIEPKIEPHAIRSGVQRVAGIKNVIAVASGKGGVGKSTTAVNLALALADEGAAVGLLDADIYGPSVPLLLGLDGRPDTKDGKTMEPLIGHGIKCNSSGFLVEADTPAIWRGPMVTQALEQLLRQTNWGALDYLIIDMPPGTGDIALTLAQKVPVAGAVIVSTPQDIALLDARKGVRMFEKVSVPVLGIVQNMSVHVCSNCGQVEHLFGQGGAQRMADEFQVPFLGELPLALSIRVDADAGRPTVVSASDSHEASLYREIANRMTARLASLPKDMAGKFPSVVVEQRRS
jgi:ATP-binding protein involved in chromosome partitioning